VAGGDRSADDIQRDIEKSRAALAEAVDQLAFRTNPKRAMDNAKQTLRQKAQSPQGRMVIGVAGSLVVLLVIRRIAKH
jgi:hypothetical protein